MSAQAVVALLETHGYTVRVNNNAYGRNNGIDWVNGEPVGCLVHHFVCSPNPDQGYIDSMVGMLTNGYDQTPGPVVGWFGDVNGVLYLICDGPANHSGRGDSSVLARVMGDQAPLGPAAQFANNNDYIGNGYYVGLETENEGDGTGWTPELLDSIVAWCAAHCIVYGWSANRSIAHFEHTNRKDDPNYLGGVSGTQFGNWLRSSVADKINQLNGNTPTPPEDEIQESDFDRLERIIARRVGIAANYAGSYVNPKTGHVDPVAGFAIVGNAFLHMQEIDGTPLKYTP